MNGSGNYLAIHFSPILALLFPIYYVAPGVSTLLVIKSVAIGAAAYPLFRIARKLTGSDMAALIASTVIIAALSPVSPFSGALNQRSHFLWYPEAEPPGQVEAIHLLLSQVPDDASILTQNHVFPHVSSRTETYFLPVLSFDRNQTRIV